SVESVNFSKDKRLQRNCFYFVRGLLSLIKSSSVPIIDPLKKRCQLEIDEWWKYVIRSLTLKWSEDRMTFCTSSKRV
ncbi:MAG: hypothetical protein ACI959_001783, partial [Limisphaerales bacterium]